MSPRNPGFAWGSRCERGVRKTNEDAVLSTPLPDGRWLAAVADGMGGLASGGTASRTALKALQDGLEAGRSLVQSVDEANRAVFQSGGDERTGTTLVAALFDGQRVRIVNVGDSRAYLFGPLGLVQVTRDHTFGAEATERGGVAARAVATSRWGATLTRSLGPAERVDVDEFGPLSLDAGVQVLLCSDGVHGVLGNHEIEGCLESGGSPDRIVDGLVALSRERGSRDNLSAVLVRWVPERAPREGRGTVPHSGGVPTLREEPDVPGGVRSRASARWDPAHLARRAPRARKRKPGVLRAVLVVLALTGLALLMLALLP